MEILCWTFSDPGSVFYITNVYLTITKDFWHMIHFSYDQEKLKLLSWHRFSLKTVVHTCGNVVLNLTLSWESFCYYECPYNRNRGHLIYGWKDSVIILEITAPPNLNIENHTNQLISLFWGGRQTIHSVDRAFTLNKKDYCFQGFNPKNLLSILCILPRSYFPNSTAVLVYKKCYPMG
jgi:hypothetical protein